MTSSVKQFKIAVIATVVALLDPGHHTETAVYHKDVLAVCADAGIGLARRLSRLRRPRPTARSCHLQFGGISIQPSEFVKIIYVFAIAGLLSNARDFRQLVIATATGGDSMC